MQKLSKATTQAALENEGMSLEDYDSTVLAFVSDGVDWMLLEDSLSMAEFREWAARAESYGELVGYFEWAGA